MRRITLSSVGYVVVPHSTTLSHKRHNIRHNLLNIKHMLRFCLQHLLETFLILQIIHPDIVTNVKTSPHKVSVILVRFE